LIHIFGHFWNALGKGYKAPEICGLKFKNGGDTARGGEKRKTATLSKLMKFGPHFGHYPKALWQGYKKPEIVAKVQKWRSFGDEGEKQKTPTFSKLMNFGPHILTLLKSPRAGLQDARNLWAKFQ